MEILKDIEGFEGYYQLSNFGYVKSIERIVKSNFGRTRRVKERVLKYGLDKDGYAFITAMKDSVGKNIRIHRLVAEYFVDGYENGLVVNHKDGNKLNNHYSNLEWVTQKENIDHSWKTGLANHKGENHFNSSLTTEKVKKIREMVRKKVMPQYSIAKLFNVSEATISRAVNFDCWKDV